MKGTPRFGRRVYVRPLTPAKPRVEVVPDLDFGGDRRTRLSFAETKAHCRGCGAERITEAHCRECGYCFLFEMPVAQCSCPMRDI